MTKLFHNNFQFFLSIVLLFHYIASARSFKNYAKIRYNNKISGSDVGDPLFLTPFLEAGRIEEARNLSLVQLADINYVTSYTGFFTVDKQYNSNIFFWYFEAVARPQEAPLLIWLQGGPGASSLFGLFTENGPFNIDENGLPVRRKYSWHLNHNLIYIDNPVGTGFSFTECEKGYVRNETQVGETLYEVMRQFYTLFPHLLDNQLYISGESYGGKYVPAMAYAIHKKNNLVNAPLVMNLHGIAIGNGWSDPIHQVNAGDYLYQLGFIDDHTLEIFHNYEQRGVDLISKGDYEAAWLLFDELSGGDVNGSSIFGNATGITFPYNYLLQDEPPNYLPLLLFNETWRKAIHVGNRSFNSNDGYANNPVQQHLLQDIMVSVAPWIEELLEHYHVVFYNGQLDLVCPYRQETDHLQHLKWSGAEQYAKAERFIWKVGKEVAGYAKEAANLVEVLVRDCGHMVPSDKPKWALDLIMRLTQNKSFRQH